MLSRNYLPELKRFVFETRNGKHPPTRPIFIIQVCLLLLSFLALAGPFGLADFAHASERINQGESINTAVRSDDSIDVSGDDEVDAYRGTGGLLLPSSYSGGSSSKKIVAQCLDCRWRYTVYCQQSRGGFCAHAVTTCPHGQVRYRVWFGKSNQSTKVVGTVCWGLAKPATRRDIEAQLSNSALRYVPALAPGVAPKTSTYTSVPIIVWSGQPSVFSPKPMYLAGHQVRISATAMWQWRWGDGTTQWTLTPGGLSQKRSLSHQYLKAGIYQVHVRTVWQATYLVPGIGSFRAVGDQIRQNAQFPIVVKASHAVLVAR